MGWEVTTSPSEIANAGLVDVVVIAIVTFNYPKVQRDIPFGA